MKIMEITLIFDAVMTKALALTVYWATLRDQRITQ